MVDRIILDESELRDLYIFQNLSQKQVANLFNCSVDTISKNLKFYNIVKQKGMDITPGMQFDRLTTNYISGYKTDSKGRQIEIWHCTCSCGNEIDRTKDYLLYSDSKSCGCIASENMVRRNKTEKAKYNKYDLSGEFGIGWTSNTNKEFYFDIEDYDKIKDYCWSENKDGYIVARNRVTHKIVKLHQIIMNKKHIDHIKHNLNDNRKSMLRFGNDALNARNRKKPSNNKSGVTGVCKRKRTGLWRAYITINGHRIELGEYKNKEDAISVRKNAEEKYFGDWSFDNSMR